MGTFIRRLAVRRVGLVLALCGLPASVSAGAYSLTLLNIQSSTGVSGVSWINPMVDLGATSSIAGHLKYRSWVSPDGVTVPYVDIKQYNNGPGRCTEIDADIWKVWANIGSSSAPNWKVLCANAAQNKAVFRVWVGNGVSDQITRIRVSAINSSSMYGKYVGLLDKGTLSQSACESPGSGYGVLRVTSTGASILQTAP